MKRVILFRKVLYSPWFLAVLPAIIIMLFLPAIGLRYSLNIEEEGKQYVNAVFVDLNSDGITELVNQGKGDPFYHVIVLDNNQRIYDQWNFRDSLHQHLSSCYFGDYDNDGFKEIYIFSYSNDSLFLNINEFFEPEGVRRNRIFISKLKIVNNTITSVLYPAGFYDINNDQFKEFYFSVTTGFALEPRVVCYFDIVNNDLKTSRFLGVNCHFANLQDIDNDNKPELFGFMSASGNYKTPAPFTDHSTWLMVFNEQLDFEFPPVEFPGLTNKLNINYYSVNDFRGYLLNHNTNSADTSILDPRIMIYSLSGVKIKERLYTEFGFNRSVGLFVLNSEKGNRIFIMEKDLIELNDKLEIINKEESPFDSGYLTYAEDIDFDGEKEFLLFSDKEEKMVVLRSDLQVVAETKFDSTKSELTFSHRLTHDHKHSLQMASDRNSWIVGIEKNKLYYPGYLMYPGIYLFLGLFISGINRINTYQVQQKESLKQRLLTLQLQGIKSQLDPHFTFNTLNSIASLLYLEDRQAAYDYMNKFTMLLRGMLNDAERVYRTLGEELDFVTTYLELEKMRFGEKFSFVIEIKEGVTQQEQVPKLVLQTFAENAIKHGLLPSTNNGVLRINAQRVDDYLKLSIEDNGIGREKSFGKSTSTGKGLKLIGEFYDILNQMNKRRISHSITDLYDEAGDASGTRVDVMVPVESVKTGDK
jgi:two-component sensor histidine kinase